MKEVWKKIPMLGCGFYEVSDIGRVRSITREMTRSNGRPFQIRGRILKQAVDDGYAKVAFKRHERHTSFRVHRLVAECFCAKSTNKLEVNHIDGNKLNNSYKNLEWCTRSENIKHAFNTGLAHPLKGSKNATAKIDEIQALVIKTLLLSNWGPIKIAREYNISKNITKDISRKRTWLHV